VDLAGRNAVRACRVDVLARARAASAHAGIRAGRMMIAARQ
jgi:hypothetical protein